MILLHPNSFSFASLMIMNVILVVVISLLLELISSDCGPFLDSCNVVMNLSLHTEFKFWNYSCSFYVCFLEQPLTLLCVFYPEESVL